MASAVDDRLPAAGLSALAPASRSPTAVEATKAPALPPGTRPAPAHDGVGRCRGCCDEAEHGECGQDVANASVFHGLAPFGLQVPVWCTLPFANGWQGRVASKHGVDAEPTPIPICSDPDKEILCVERARMGCAPLAHRNPCLPGAFQQAKAKPFMPFRHGCSPARHVRLAELVLRWFRSGAVRPTSEETEERAAACRGAVWCPGQPGFRNRRTSGRWCASRLPERLDDPRVDAGYLFAQGS